MKLCKRCNTQKHLSEFSKCSSHRDGLQWECKECNKKYRISNKKRITLQTSQRKEEQKKYNKNYYLENKESYIESRKEYNKIYYKKTKEKQLQYQKEYKIKRYHSDVEYKWKVRIKAIFGRFKNYSNYKLEEGKTEEYLGYSYKDFIKLFRHFEDYDIDHKVPLSWFKPNTPASICCSLSNLQPLKRDLNKTKSNRFCHPISKEYYLQILKYIKEEYKNKLEYLE